MSLYRRFSDVFISLESRDGIVVVATSPGAGRSWVRIPVWARDSSLLQNVQIGPGVHALSFYFPG